MDDAQVDEFVEKLKIAYNTAFRGKPRGRFLMPRVQFREGLGLERLHGSTFLRVADRGLRAGYAIMDLDDVFTIAEVRVHRKYRKLPKAIFEEIFTPERVDDIDEGGDDDDE